jgi:RES domain-containing protein
VTLKAWRLVKWKHALHAFNGHGAKLHGSRWTSPGRPAVFVSETQALAALETIVHFDPDAPPLAYAFFSVTFPSPLIQPLPFDLAPNWKTMPAATRAIGDAWLKDTKSACILDLPSALVPEGKNYLINPEHHDFSKLTIGRALPFAFDFRIQRIESAELEPID